VRHVVDVVDLLGEARHLFDDAQLGRLLGGELGVAHGHGGRRHAGIPGLAEDRRHGGGEVLVGHASAHLGRNHDRGAAGDVEGRVVARGLDLADVLGDGIVQEGPVEDRGERAVAHLERRRLRDDLRGYLRPLGLDLDGHRARDRGRRQALLSLPRRLLGHAGLGGDLGQRHGSGAEEVGVGHLLDGAGDVDAASVLARDELRGHAVVAQDRLGRRARDHAGELLDPLRQGGFVDHDDRIDRGGSEEALHHGQRAVEPARRGIHRGFGVEGQARIRRHEVGGSLVGGHREGGIGQRPELLLQGRHGLGPLHAADLDPQHRGVGRDVPRGAPEHAEVERQGAGDDRQADEEGSPILRPGIPGRAPALGWGADGGHLGTPVGGGADLRATMVRRTGGRMADQAVGPGPPPVRRLGIEAAADPRMTPPKR